MQKAKEYLLVLAAKKGDEKAFTFLYKFYQQPLLRFAFKISGDSQLAQEADQNSWLNVAKKLILLRDPRAFKSWLFKSVRWRVYDLMDKSKNDKTVLLEDLNVCEPIYKTKNKTDERTDTLLTLVDTLPEIDKQAIYLFYLEEMKIAEISAILHIPSGTVKSRLNRSRRKLREQVKKK